MSLHEQQFSEKYDFTRIDHSPKTLIIASTGRCGSHMLGHALHETNKFGYPLEYANLANLREWKKRLKTDDLQSTLAELQRRRTSPNGVFGIKIHYSHIKQFGGFDNLLKCFPNAYFVLLSRENVLLQAVSLSIASQTGVWISGQKAINNNPLYNFNHIDESLRSIIIDNSSWRYKLAANGCNYIEMDFDDVRNNLATSLKKIATFVNCKLDENNIPNEQITKNQSNQVNIEWATQFILEKNKNDELFSNLKDFSLMNIKKKIKKIIF